MKLSVFALDYDGTIAEDGVLHPSIRPAIDHARSRGIATILVTGRILADLRRVAGDLRFVDAIVAENGAVLVFPRSGRSLVLGPPPPKTFLTELARRGVPVDTGECIVETDATNAPTVLDVIRQLQLPLALIFNRGRLMILPQGISKATGLREMLTALRLSEHNAVAMGDAENDHSMLASCEVGVAVGWGSDTLKAMADEILPGTGPAAVGLYIRRTADQPSLFRQRTGRRQLTLGQTTRGEQVALPVRSRNVLIVGDPRSGKSWIAGLLAEQLILNRYCVCVIDPEGDYQPLSALPGVLTLGGDDTPPRPRDIARALRHPDTSVVVDLSELPYPEKCGYVGPLLAHLAEIRRQTGLPHQIILDEAHYFLHGPNALDVLDLDLASYTLVTCHLSRLYPTIPAASEAVIATRVSDPHDIQLLGDIMKPPSRSDDWHTRLGGLEVGEALLVRDATQTGDMPCQFQLAPRLSDHVRHRQKYVAVGVADRHAFVFTHNGVPMGERAYSLVEFVAIVQASDIDPLDGHLRRGDFSRWIAGVFGDHHLADEIRQLERRYRQNPGIDIRGELTQAIAERYAMRQEESQFQPIFE
jgi:hydroxymethylpyrimidine pyrophosphatase-like HAD family hydrolase